MGLFTSLFSGNVQKKPAAKQEIVVLLGIAKFEQQIAVVDQPTLEAICGPRVPRGVNRFETAWLYLEDKNPHDKNAIRVQIRGKQAGYLHHEDAMLYRQYLTASGKPGAIGQCQAVIRGGWLSSDGRKGPYEVWLDLPRLYQSHSLQ